MAVILNLQKCTLGFQVLNNFRAAFIAIHSAVFAPTVCDMAVICHNIYDFKIMAKANLIVVRVMCRRDFNNACSELNINIIIGNNGNFTVNNRKHKHFSD